MSINIDEIFKKYPYLEAYKNFTDLKVKDNPKEAVGGMWDEIGNLQFNYLVKNGLLKNIYPIWNLYKTFVNSKAVSPIIDLPGSKIIFVLYLFKKFLIIELYFL